MKLSLHRGTRAWLALGLFAFNLAITQAVEPPAQPPGWRYLLLGESMLLDDCPICGRPAIPRALRGTFDLWLLEQNPVSARYALTNLQFSTSNALDDGYRITGSGELQIGGHLALLQDAVLRTWLSIGRGPAQYYEFTNEQRTVPLQFPLIDVSLVQTQASLTQVIHLRLVAAPVRELWFSTRHGLTPASGTGQLSAADLLSSAGHVPRRGTDLVSAFQIAPSADLNLDGLEVAPGGEVLFSLDRAYSSATAGILQDGDWLSERGRIVNRAAELTAAFAFAQPEAGLDAMTMGPGGEVLFSIRTNRFSQTLNQTVSRGDLLSSEGQVYRGQQQLLSRFTPATPGQDYGLDAAYVWPHGEVWFSLEEGFEDRQFGLILPGDLLSDQGIVVFRNLDLLSPFSPLEDLADFGLDALVVVTDLTATNPPPRWTLPDRVGDHLQFRGTPTGRFFQLLHGSEAAGPFIEAGPIVTVIPPWGPVTNLSRAFFWLRQW